MNPEHIYFDVLSPLVGLFLGFFGYRFYRPCLFLSGYLVGGCIAYYLGDRSDQVEHAAVALTSGIVGGFITSNVYPLGVATLGGLWGVSAALMMNGLLISRVGHSLGGTNTTLIIVTSLLGVMGSICAIMAHPNGGAQPTPLQKRVIFAQTAMPGAVLVAKGISQAIDPDLSGEFELAQNKGGTGILWFEAVIMLVLAVGFFVVQSQFTHRQQCGCDETFESNEEQDAEHEALVVAHEHSPNGLTKK